MKIELGGNVLFEKHANLMRGIEGVGGKMFVTAQRILFKPHMINIQSEPLELLISDIKSIERRNSLYLIPNGITIELVTGQKYKFVIWRRSKFIDYIKKQIPKL